MAISKNHTIITDSFLLESKLANTLYHTYLAHLPIIDYHNHLSPKAIAKNTSYDTLTDIWLTGDHYKYRAMRAWGVPEKFISGAATKEQKFLAWADCMPNTLRNPLFHWSHMELKNSFGINEYLNKNNALAIYKNANKQLQKKALNTRGILTSYKVELVGTTDDPCDNLQYHKLLQKETGAMSNKINATAKMLPSFRPDKIFQIENKEAFMQYLHALEKAANCKIKTIADLLGALEQRVNYFHDNGCRIADHGLNNMPSSLSFTKELDIAFTQFIQNKKDLHFSMADNFVGVVLLALSKMYYKKGWVQQFHLGPIRNNNTRLQEKLGFDAGADSIGDFAQVKTLSHFLNTLDIKGQLSKTILYNSNPADNEVFATLCGNFNESGIRGKVQFGAAWWFLDQKEGIEKQINAISNMGLISTFVGMTTDSRSILSFARHEYFRRVICNLFAKEMMTGLLPNDEKWVGAMLQNIAYHNAKNYFNL
jgi:glucuronate isomerase